MAWDWKPGTHRAYVSVKEELVKEQSAKNFKEMISECQSIIEYHWNEAKNMDEYAGLVQNYEKTVLAFWRKYKTLESLYHIVYFYGDWTFTLWIYGLDDPVRRLEHMKKGILYAQLYHERVNKDYSAVLCIRLYRALYEICPEEGLGYLRKGCSMAKEWAHRLKTPLLMDEYLRVSLAALRVVDEVGWESEDEKQAAGQEFGVFIEDYRAVKEETGFFPLESQKERFREEWELPLIPGQIGQRIGANAGAVLKEYPDEMERAYRLIKFIFGIRRKEGLLALETAIGRFADFDAPFCDFLPDYIIALVDGMESDLLAEMMANEFEIRKPDDFEALVLYLYILTILIAKIASRYENILSREQALAAWSRMVNECLVYLPDEYRSVFQI